LHRVIRDTIDVPERAWGVYDPNTDQYQLYYAITGGTAYPQRAVFLNLTDGSWAQQTFDPVAGGISLTRGFSVTGLAESSSATSWGGLDAASIRWADLNRTWASLGTVTASQDRRDIYVGSSTGTVYYYDSNATSDNGTPVPCKWRSSALWGEMPGQQKTVTEWRVDYNGASDSSLTLRFSQNQGGGFQSGERVNLPAVSGLSQGIGYPYVAARNPMFQVESEAVRHRLFRFYITARIGGR
jgi:hypothetical protein